MCKKTKSFAGQIYLSDNYFFKTSTELSNVQIILPKFHLNPVIDPKYDLILFIESFLHPITEANLFSFKAMDHRKQE